MHNISKEWNAPYFSTRNPLSRSTMVFQRQHHGGHAPPPLNCLLENLNACKNLRFSTHQIFITGLWRRGSSNITTGIGFGFSLIMLIFRPNKYVFGVGKEGIRRETSILHG